MITLHLNRLFNGAEILDFSSEAENYPAAFILSQTKRLTWRTEGITAEQIIFKNIPGTYRQFTLLATNLTDTAQVSLELDDEPTFTDAESFNFSGAQIKAGLCDLGANKSKPYARISLTDSANADGYLEIGAAWLGQTLFSGYIKSLKQGYFEKDTIVQTKDLITYALKKPALLEIKITAVYFDATNHAGLMEIINACRQIQPVRAEFSDVAPVSQTTLELARIADRPEINYTGRNRWEVNLIIQEAR